MKNKYLALVFLLITGIVAGCGGGGGSGTTAVTCSSYSSMTSTGKYKISVRENGIYVISFDTLKSLCFDSSAVDLTKFKIQNFDPTPNVKTLVDIPVSYDSANNIEFYGVGVNRNDYTAPNADYTETNVYWLVPATTTAAQMSVKTSASGSSPISPMTTLHVEQNKIWWDSMTGGAGTDHWFWDHVSDGAISQPYNFTVNNFDGSSSSAISFTGYFQSQTTTVSSHNINGNLNLAGLFSFSASWNGTGVYRYATPVSGSIINGSANAFQFTPGFGDTVYFNWLELEYPAMALNDTLIFHGNIPAPGSYSFSINGFSQNSIELFDISDPKNPRKFDGSLKVVANGSGYQLSFGDSFSVPNDYIAISPARRKTPVSMVRANPQDLTTLPVFDYAMIAHESLMAPGSRLPDLALYRQGQGFKVQIVMIGDVYDNFSGGIFTPQAIQDFLSDIHSRYGATYALLAGDASVDYKNYKGFGEENLIPTNLIEYSYGQTASDFWFLPKAGNLPQMAIGRLPAKNLTELNGMINKIINYDTLPAGWNYNLSFVAADTFDTISENLISDVMAIPNISPGLIYHSYYFSTSTTSSSTFHPIYNAAGSYADLHSAVINSMANPGSLVTNYFGHGSVGLWANGYSGILQNFLQATDFNSLANGNLTFLVTLDCLNGFFAGSGEGQYDPQLGGAVPYSLAETAVKSPGGAVASFSPAGQGYTTSHSALAKELYTQIFGNVWNHCLQGPPGAPCVQTSPYWTIGYAIQKAEQQLILNFANPQDAETVSNFVLLGDPATQLLVP